MRTKLIFEGYNDTYEFFHHLPVGNSEPLSIKYKERYWDLVVSSLTSADPYLTYVEGILNRYTSNVYDLDLARNGGFPSLELKCECGSDKLGHPGHSDWCPKGVKLGRGYV